MSKITIVSAIALLLVAASVVRCEDEYRLKEEDYDDDSEEEEEEEDEAVNTTVSTPTSSEETPVLPTAEEPTTTTEAPTTTTERLPLRYQMVVRNGKERRLMKETRPPKTECEETTKAPWRRRGESVRNARSTTTTTETPVGRSSDWRAREIERRRGLRRASEGGASKGEKETSRGGAQKEASRGGGQREASRGGAGKETSRGGGGKEASRGGEGRTRPTPRYVEYEESEVFEDGKPVVKKKRVVKPMKEDEDSVKESSQHEISSTPRSDSEEEDEEPSSSKKRKHDEYEDLYRYFHDDDDEYDFGPIGRSSHRSVRRRHYDPYQDYFDFVYSLTHPEDPHGHHSTPVEEDSTPEGSSFRKRYFKAWHSSSKNKDRDNHRDL